MNNWINKKTNEEILEINKNERLNQTNISKYGFLMTIIKYRNASDIDIQFEDGTIVKHKLYKNFKSGNICKTNNDLAIIRVGETNINSDGLNMCIIKYITANNIDVQFDDGTIVFHKDYHAFKRGSIKNPNYIKPKIEKTKDIKPIINRIGETSLAKNNQKMTIIAYRARNDIDIQFEDGTIVTNKRYQHFITGEIKNPNVIYSNNHILIDRIGETITTKDGIKMTIVEYRNRDDIDIQLDDGSILKHQLYERFKVGHINCSTYRKNKKLGETKINKNGQKMTIIKYNKDTNIDVQFEDGYIAKHIRYKNFLCGNVFHPMPYMLKDIQIESKAYNYQNEMNFFYICTKCHHHDIGTIKEIQHHICKEN